MDAGRLCLGDALQLSFYAEVPVSWTRLGAADVAVLLGAESPRPSYRRGHGGSRGALARAYVNHVSKFGRNAWRCGTIFR
ncbi:MAG TPA: hypothetical protein VFC35_00100 [Gemmatimonadaceae bacterium]|nr:hypothetical protein [Gemmatimonadaceae bacterium]